MLVGVCLEDLRRRGRRKQGREIEGKGEGERGRGGEGGRGGGGGGEGRREEWTKYSIKVREKDSKDSKHANVAILGNLLIVCAHFKGP